MHTHSIEAAVVCILQYCTSCTEGRCENVKDSGSELLCPKNSPKLSFAISE